MLRILMASGVFSLVLGSIEHPASGWIEGTAILLAGMGICKYLACIWPLSLYSMGI